MKLLLAFVLALFAGGVAASEPCNPLSLANKGLVTGSITVDNQVANYAAWWKLADNGDYATCLLGARSGYVIKHPVLSTTATMAEKVAAYWALNVTVDCSTGADNLLMQACDQGWVDAQATKPPPPYAVRPNGTNATRPTYPVVNGVLGPSSNGRVDVKDATGRQTACDPREVVKVGTSTYMRVKATPGTAALCGATS